MPFVNFPLREISAKLVYYGPGLCGKTTNLKYVHAHSDPTARGNMVTLDTEAERTLFFDFLPLDLGKVRGFKVRLQLYSVPGQVMYNATRKLILRGVDGMVFVADSQAMRLDANIISLENLEENLAEQGQTLAEIPHVIQYNKRDLPELSSVEELRAALNPRGVPEFEAAASSGHGVFETLKAVSRLVLVELAKTSVMGARPQEPRTEQSAVVAREGTVTRKVNNG